MSDEYLKGFDPLENKENVSVEDKIDNYCEWILSECNEPHNELFWIIDSAINPTKETAEDVREAVNEVYNRMNEK